MTSHPLRKCFTCLCILAEEKKLAVKSILFGLCFFHSLLLGRKKFGIGIGLGAGVLGLMNALLLCPNLAGLGSFVDCSANFAVVLEQECAMCI